MSSIYLEEQLVDLLLEKGFHITCAESLTGGEIAAAIVNVPGASGILEESYITYSNAAKIKLAGVREETLSKYTEISAETAAEMAEGIRKRAGTEIAISATGLAGPGGGTEEFPVGLVFIGCSLYGKAETRRLLLRGDRAEVRKQSVQAALKLAISCLIKYKGE